MSLETGHILDGKYRIVRVLGKGGMGSVYEGENTRIHRRVAIKVLHAHVASNSEVVQRFEREAQAAGRIGSEHIVEVLDLGQLPAGERYMVMEYLEGESLGERLKKRRRLAPQAIAPIMHQLLTGLSGAHTAEIIHRDLKPDNVFLLTSRGGQHDFVKILDFGVSKFSALDSEMDATRVGSVMGTPFYMSPEQAKGGEIDKRSDLYAVGVILYQCVTGRLPHQADTFNELIFKIALEPPEPVELAVPGLDAGFAAIVRKSMAREPAERFQSAQEFQQALGKWMMTSALGPSAELGTSSSGVHESLLTQGYPSPTTFSGNELSRSLTGPQQELATIPQPQRRRPVVAIGLLGAVLFSGGVFAAYKLTRPAPLPAAAAATAAPATASPTAEAAQQPTPSATATILETATDSAGETASGTTTTESAGSTSSETPPKLPTVENKKPQAAGPTTKPTPATAKPAAAATKPTERTKPAGVRAINSEL
jgi:serine/threonine-protein kinase